MEEHKISPTWFMDGGREDVVGDVGVEDDDHHDFFVQKWYVTC